MQNMRKSLISLAVLLCLTACNESSGESSKAEHPLEQTTTSQFTQTTQTSAEQTTAPPLEASQFEMVTPTLPTQFPEDNITRAENFCVPKKGGVSLRAVNGDRILLEVYIDNRNDTGDLTFYQYNIQTHETIPMEGRIQNWHQAAGKAANVDGKFYEVIETFGGENQEQVHYVVDFQQNRVDELLRERVNPGTDSFCFTYPVNDDEYAEWWFDMDTANTHHIKLYRKDGTAEEIWTKHVSSAEYWTQMRLNDNRIYEYLERKDNQDIQLNIYDMSGKMLSSTALQQLAEILREAKRNDSPNDEIERVEVFGDYVAFWLRAYNGIWYLFNESLGKAFVLDNCGYISTEHSSGREAEHHLFRSYDTQGDEVKINLFCIDNAGNITALAQNVGADLVTDGKTVAYLKDGALYYITL